MASALCDCRVPCTHDAFDVDDDAASEVILRNVIMVDSSWCLALAGFLEAAATTANHKRIAEGARDSLVRIGKCGPTINACGVKNVMLRAFHLPNGIPIFKFTQTNTTRMNAVIGVGHRFGDVLAIINFRIFVLHLPLELLFCWAVFHLDADLGETGFCVSRKLKSLFST
jgi:hypothetical protein